MRPRLLLVEDDPVSRAFLTAAAEALPASVDAAANCAEARAHAAAAVHDLWLVDANLPDGSGADLLAALRARDAATPAIAHTASHDRHELERLRACGFADVLVKPIAAELLHAALHRLLDHPAVEDAAADYAALPDWDDAAALSALNGQQAHVVALRRLFLGELAGQRLAVDAALAADDVEGAASVLHKLRASCGFVGAMRLAGAVQGLESDPRSADALRHFDEAVDDLIGTGLPD